MSFVHKSSAQPIRMVQAIYSLEMGGSEALARRIAASLNKKGEYVCSLYAIDQGGAMAQFLPHEDIAFRIFGRHQGSKIRLISQLVKQYRADKMQLVHTHHLGQLFYAGIAARLAGARLIHTEHEYYSLRQKKEQRLRNWYLFLVSSSLL